MKFLVRVICVSEAVERREQVFEMEREHLTMETLGLGLLQAERPQFGQGVTNSSRA